MYDCLVCKEPQLVELLDLGPQPMSNRFPLRAEDDHDRHPLRFGSCRHCGLAQLIEPPPPELIRAEVDWIRYNEPEGHLDETVAVLSSLPDIGSASRFAGLTYKEDTTLRRLNDQGFAETCLFDPLAGDAAKNPLAGLETVQQRLVPSWAEDASRYQQADVVIARHILEHAQMPSVAVTALKALVRPDGYLVFEVPGNERIFAHRDACFLWEEHVLYFTEHTLRQTLQMLDLEIVQLLRFQYPLEDALVCITRVATIGNDRSNANKDTASNEFEAAAHFVADFADDRTALFSELSDFKTRCGPIAVFGAGHLACKFLNFYGVGDLIEFVADDHPNKQGGLIPGCHKPIRPSSDLHEAGIRLALLSVNPESEARVMEKHTRPDGTLRFASLFRSSSRAFPTREETDGET